MMNMKKILSASALVCILTAITSLALAANKIDADDFVDEVSARNIAEIEGAKLALEKSTSTDIQEFAKKMITEHSSVNMQLANIASRKNLEVSEEAELTAKAKKLVLKYRGDESFDGAYAKNQVKAHEETIELFQRASASDDAEIASYAKQTLPKLQNYLNMAKELVAVHDKE